MKRKTTSQTFVKDEMMEKICERLFHVQYHPLKNLLLKCLTIRTTKDVFISSNSYKAFPCAEVTIYSVFGRLFAPGRVFAAVS